MYAPTPPLPITPATRRVLLLGTSLGVAALVALSVRTGPPAPDGLPGADVPRRASAGSPSRGTRT